MKQLILLFLSCLSSLYSVYSQNSDIHFRHLNTENGLSHTSVLSLYADQHDFIWIGTKEGLNRFNGTRIDHYDLNENNNSFKLSNEIKKIIGDKKDNIYILTADGLAQYNYNTGSSKTLWYDSDVNAMFYNENLYVGRHNVLYIFEQSTQQFVSKTTLPEKDKITALLKSNDYFYIGTTSGLYALNLETNNLKKIISNKSEVSFLYEDSLKNIWVSTWNYGLLCIKGDKIIEHFMHSDNSQYSISSNFVRECCEDLDGNLWIGTFSGLDKYDIKSQKFTHYKASSKSGSLSHSSVWSIIRDKQGTIWLSTYFGGINYFNPEHIVHKEYIKSKDETKGLSSPIVSRMIEDNKDNLWICTEGAGVNVLNRKSDIFKWYLPNSNKNSISNENIKAIYFDSKQNNMWFGSHLGGLSCLNLKTQQFKHYKYNSLDPHSIPSNIVRDIIPYNNQLILATDKGVSFFDLSTQQFKSLDQRQYQGKIIDVYAILVDNDEKLWIAVVGDGLFKYDLKSNKFDGRFSNNNDSTRISNNNINSLYKDSQNKIYLCTSGSGIDIISPDNSIKNINTTDGLISNSTYNIAETSPENFIITTNLGVSLFDSTNNNFTNFTNFNGFSLTSINDNALFITSDKTIYIGGLNGLISIKLSSLNPPIKNFDIFLDRLFINNKEILPDDKSQILKTSFINTKKITLPHNYSSIGVDITTNNYFSYNKSQLEYMLEGFSNKWIPLSPFNPRITYTNLNPGKYKLIVRLKSDYTNNIAPIALEIKILPPWYFTIWAYCSYIALALLIVLYFLNAYKKRIDLLTSLKYEKEHNKNIEKLNQSKLNFFTNISHEFRTPLTVIISQLDYLLNHNKFTTDIYNKLLSIYKNSLQLNELTNELLDFRKHEAGKVQLHVAKHNIVQFLDENYILFKEFAESKHIEFSFTAEIDKIEVWYDTAQLQKVINNLLSNAFKYTPKNKSIKIIITKDDSNCIIQIIDTGEGIKTEDLKHIFERFYQVDNSNLLNGGSGIGLALTKSIIELHDGDVTVESQLGKGSIFTIKLPLGNSHFNKNQIINNAEDDKYSNESLAKGLEFLKADYKNDNTNPLEKKETKLLIAEDNFDLRQTLVEIFSYYYDVIDAPDGEVALKLIEEEVPELIISDIVMPKMTGIELCKAVKSNINTCHIPVVLLTAKTSLEHNLEGLRIGADDYISKPFNAEILVSRCNNLINSRRLLREVFSKQPQVEPQKLATNPIDKELIDKATRIIQENLDNSQFNMNEFAQEMGMSRTNLFNKIKYLTGQTPNNFISTMRLKRAAYLLKNNPELNVSDISTITGFSSSHYFSKCFKDTYQQTPTEYREA